MAFKIALDAGHGKNTAGKRCSKALDPTETREWFLNNRICQYIQEALLAYEGYELIRVDDVTGNTDTPLESRVKKANTFKADLYLSIHHNAGANNTTAGGIMAYTYTKVDTKTKEWQKAFYNAAIAATGLKGNRSSPLATADFYVCRKTTMPCVLIENGFMDSKVDVPIILTDSFARKLGDAYAKAIAQNVGLTLKPIPVAVPAPAGTIYRVQVGAFSNLDNAKKLAAELESKGYTTYIKIGG